MGDDLTHVSLTARIQGNEAIYERRFETRQALGDRDQYHLYLEEVDSLPDVWERRRATGGLLPTDEAVSLLLSGRAYAQLPHEVHLVFLKIDRRVRG